MSKIHSISISNFRGIQKLEQVFDRNTQFVCLIGCGDSGKTTILEAINLVLYPNWNVIFTDNDFHNQDIDKPIEISVTLYNLPESIMSENKYGLYLRGINSNNEITDNIGQLDTAAITIKLVVDKSLEPNWYVVNNRSQADIEIKYTDRDKFNMFFISDYIDRHFSLGKGSPLYKLLRTTSAEINANEVLLEIIRDAKKQIDNSNFSDLDTLLNNIKINAEKFGISLSNINSTIDFRDILTKEGKLNLHDENTPLRLKGKGSKRLLSIAIQLELFKINNGGILLIDEVEQGLESHRVQNLIRMLKKTKDSQIFITTHSRDVLVELDASDLFKVASSRDKIFKFDASSQGNLRTNPHAFFAKKIILCEGATEVGLVRGIDSYNTSNNDYRFANNAVSYVDCGGDTKILDYIKSFEDKGYDILIFCDSDNDVTVKALKDYIRQKGLKHVYCETGNAIEQQIFSDVDFNTCKEIMSLEKKVDDDDVNESIKIIATGEGFSYDDNYLSTDSKELRGILGKAAIYKTRKENKAWFKNITYATPLGEICMTYIGEYKDTPLYKMLTKINQWANND